MGLMGMTGGRITKLPSQVIVINFIMEDTHLYRVFIPLNAKDIQDTKNKFYQSEAPKEIAVYKRIFQTIFHI